MKYKVGDRVRIKSLDWYTSNKNRLGEVWTESLGGERQICFDRDMIRYCGMETVIFSVARESYVLKGIPYAWTDEMIEGLVEYEEIEFTEEDKYWCDIMSESAPTTYILPEGYQFVDENGNVINATKIVLEKKKKEYPKNYNECLKIIGIKLSDCYIQGYKSPLLEDLQELLICRDAYWKIEGEEMRLGKPWEPDWDNLSTNHEFIKINKGCFTYSSRVLVFPTAEMRDAFYENFKELIEQCKELL